MTASPTAGDPADVPPAPADVPPAPADVPPAAADGTDGPDEEEPRRRRKLLLLLLLLLAFAILLGLAIWYLLFREPLPPLPGLPDSQVPTYTTSIYGVSRPVGVAVAADGNRIYVSESSGNRVVRIFDQGGTQLGTMSPGGDATSNVPVYIAIDPLTSEVYVSDRLMGTIHVYDSNGTYQREFQPAVERPGWQPLGIAFAPDGTMYVTDLAGVTPVVVVFDRQGQVVREIGAAEQMSFPNGVALDKAGNVYVTDSNNGRLLVFDPAGGVVARIGRGAQTGKLGLPRGIAIDERDRVLVVDTTGQGVQVDRTYQGEQTLEYLGIFGSQGVADGQFSFPNGIAVDGRGRVYVADSANDRVQVWSY